MSENQQQKVLVALAILSYDGLFLMQLRDDIPGINYPGCWGLFGGHLEAGETPEEGLKRELIEEISYAPPAVTEFGLYSDERVIRHIYHANLSVGLDQLELKEGWDFDLLTPAEIQKGERYSQKADQIRPLGQIHQQILLDFISKGNW